MKSVAHTSTAFALAVSVSMTLSYHVLAVVCLGGIVAGCADDGGGDRVSDAVSVLSAALCERLTMCDLGPDESIRSTAEEARQGGPAACLTLFEDKLGLFRHWGERVARGVLVVDMAKVERCAAALIACEITTQVADCQEMLEGKAGLGAACEDDFECSGDAFCEREDASCPGTCVARGGSGERCGSAASWGLVTDDWPTGSCSQAAGRRACRDDETARMCVPIPDPRTVGLGEPCGIAEDGAAVNCERGLACDGACRSLVPNGSACDAETLCLTGASCVDGVCRGVTYVNEVGLACADEVVCNWLLNLGCGDDGRCVEKSDGSVGAACTRETYAVCREGLYCHVGADDYNLGTCRPSLRVGSLCEGAQPFQCGFDAYCDPATKLCVALEDECR